MGCYIGISTCQNFIVRLMLFSVCRIKKKPNTIKTIIIIRWGLRAGIMDDIRWQNIGKCSGSVVGIWGWGSPHYPVYFVYVRNFPC